jgi:hypothetical protein
MRIDWRVLVGVWIALGIACSGGQEAPAAPGADASAPEAGGDDDGSSDAATWTDGGGVPSGLTLTVDGNGLTIVQGAIGSLTVHVARDPAVAPAPVVVGLGQLPPGVTAGLSSVTIPAAQNSATLNLATQATTPQVVTTLAVTATSGNLSDTKSVPLVVRGAAGAVDTTFGDQGQLTSPRPTGS